MTLFQLFCFRNFNSILRFTVSMPFYD